jgi:hypothetical protein
MIEQQQLIVDEMNGRDAPIGDSALTLLQAVYRDPLQPLSVRLRAAKEALPFESPKLAVIASIEDPGTFAKRLDRAIARSGQATKVIEHQPEAEDRPMRRPRWER